MKTQSRILKVYILIIIESYLYVCTKTDFSYRLINVTRVYTYYEHYNSFILRLYLETCRDVYKDLVIFTDVLIISREGLIFLS